jgi:hypothetical protein
VTAVVGLVHAGAIYLGADSAGVSGWNVQARLDPKVFANGPFLVGFSTSFRMGQLLRWSFTPPERHADVEIERFMSTTFVDAVRACLKAGGYAKKENEVEAAGEFLVGYEGRLFGVDADYQVEETLSGYNVIGSGRDAALGALYASKGQDPDRRVRIALEAAAAHNIGVRPPFIYLNSL